jgi:hypothetical protein
LLANIALAVALVFTVGQFWVIFAEAKLLLSEAHPIPRTTLLALRSLPILNTVSPAAPTLWCVLGVYVWTVGRMARLRLVSALSRISPDDGVADRAPYMHAGQLGSLPEVIDHYDRAPQAPAGHSELKPLRLSVKEKRQIEAFLRTLK